MRYGGRPICHALKVKVASLNCMRHSSGSQCSCMRSSLEENGGREILTEASSVPVQQRPQTKRRHRHLSCAAASTGLQFIPLSFISLSRFRLHVFLGLPLLRCPSGFQYRDHFGIHVLSLRNPAVVRIPFEIFLYPHRYPVHHQNLITFCSSYT